MAVFQDLPVEGFVIYSNALIQIDFVRLEIYLHPGLSVKFRRIGEPNEYCLRLFRKIPCADIIWLLNI